MNRISVLLSPLVCTVVLWAGCSKQAELAKEWSPPVKVIESKDGLAGGVELYRWQNTIIALQGLDDGSARWFAMNRDSNSWSEVQLTGIPRGYMWAYPVIDQASDRVLFEQGYMENDQLIMSIFLGRMNGNFIFRDAVERKWFNAVP